MFYLFYGSDTDASRARARGVIAVMKKKRPGAEFFRMTGVDWNQLSFEELIGSMGLFEKKSIIFGDGILENAEAKSWVLEHVDSIGASENAFIFLERTLDAPTLKKLEKGAQESKKFEGTKTSTKFPVRDFNTFALADALGSRKKVEFWALLSEAFMRGITPEEINGVLFWQIKSILIAENSKSAAEAGLKPFVYAKSKQFARVFSQEELVNLSRSLVSLYHDAHRGLRDFSFGLERLALTL